MNISLWIVCLVSLVMNACQDSSLCDCNSCLAFSVEVIDKSTNLPLVDLELKASGVGVDEEESRISPGTYLDAITSRCKAFAPAGTYTSVFASPTGDTLALKDF